MSSIHSVSTIAPHRVSLVGGGSDLPSISNRIGGGCISFTIPKYIFVTCKMHSPSQFGEKYRLQYSSTEVVQDRADIKNNIIRETLQYLQLDDPLVISVTSDLPSGSGLGSSSSFTVALLMALRLLFGIATNPFELAEDAFQIEKAINGNNVGRQDQYAAAVGGFNYYRFARDGSVSIHPIFNSNAQISNLSHSSLLIWTGLSRSASSILQSQVNLSTSRIEYYEQMNSLTAECYFKMKDHLFTTSDYASFVFKNWDLKRSMSSSITNSKIDTIINLCLNNGTMACKLLGAGGGGYILAIGVNQQTRKCITEIGLHSEELRYDPNGVRVLSTFNL